MKSSFKEFLAESGKSMSKFNVSRASKRDIEVALALVANVLGLEEDMLIDSLIGSTVNTHSGHKKDSGDIDIAISTSDISQPLAHEKMMKLTSNKGTFNKGTKIGSYAVDVGDKKVQVDLMFVTNKQWAKFMYHSSHDNGSKYPGAVRNILLMAAVRHSLIPGQDLIIKRDDQVVVRASRALKLDTGLERLFKAAKYNEKSNKFNQGMDKMDPKDLQKIADTLEGKRVKFSHGPDIISDPDTVAKLIFGDGVKAKDLMTAEDVIAQIKKRADAQQILKDAKKTLEKADLPVPPL